MSFDILQHVNRHADAFSSNYYTDNIPLHVFKKISQWASLTLSEWVAMRIGTNHCAYKQVVMITVALTLTSMPAKTTLSEIHVTAANAENNN